MRLADLRGRARDRPRRRSSRRNSRRPVRQGRLRSHGYRYFFFFQAEDGIRDRNVTGVQTCALQIYFDDERIVAKPQQHGREIRHGFLGAMEGKRELQEHGAEFSGGAQHVKTGAHGALVFGGGRSEERRVGNESGWRMLRKLETTKM